MHGMPCAVQGSPSSLRVMKRLRGILELSAFLKEPLPSINFAQVFSSKGVDDQGEEVRAAKKNGLGKH